MSVKSTVAFVSSRTGKRALFASAAGCLAVFATQAPALAQSAEVDEITVTASRINREGYEAPTPTHVVGQEAIQQLAPTAAVEIVNNLPQMTPQVANGNSISIGNARPNFRGLGPVRALVLLDGNRVAYTDPLGGVDMNIMPTALIRGVEVVSGGASADWGSDAIAGIINFHIDNTFEGIKGSFQCGQTMYDDGQGCGGGVGVGKAFFNDRLNVVAAFDWAKNNGILDPTRRPWNKGNYARILNPAYAPGNGQYQNLITDNACYGGASSAGLITSGPLRGTTFTDQGDPIPFTFGQYAGGSNTLWMIGGTCEQAYSMRVGGVEPQLKRANGYGKVTFEVSDALEVYGEVLDASTETMIRATPNYNFGDIVVRLDNAFLHPQLRAAMVQAGITSFNMGRYQPEFGVGEFDMTEMVGTNDVRRYVAGARGDLGGSWTWDAVFQKSKAVYHSWAYGSRNNVKWARALDAVINPATGLPACRINVDANPANDDPACVPADIFGRGSISQSVVGYVGGTAEGIGTYKSKSAAANVQGDLFTLPAGVVSFAAGVEARKDSLNIEVDEASRLIQWRYQGLQFEEGEYSVKEGYAEAVVPILKDAALVSNLEMNIAGRITDYSNSGTVKTWKIGFNYAPFDANTLRFRGTYSKDIRAPTLHELVATKINTGSGLVDPYCGGCFRPVPNYIGGNRDLVPEEAKTLVMGVVFRPTFLDGFTASIDYYNIKIEKGIVTLPGATIAQNCFLGLTEFCSALVFENGQIVETNSVPLNSQGLEREGVDIEATYRVPIDQWFESIPGSLTLRSMFAYVSKQNQKTSGALINSVGQIVGAGVPRWNGFVSANYIQDKWDFFLQLRYVGPGLVEKQLAIGNPFYLEGNHIRAYYYLNANVQYEVNENLEVFAGVDNILNQSPPITGATTNTTSARSNSPWYDVAGRAYKAGIRFQF